MLLNSFLFYILKIITIIVIREIFREMLQEHETKQEEMFTKREKLVLELTSRHQTLITELEA